MFYIDRTVGSFENDYPRLLQWSLWTLLWSVQHDDHGCLSCTTHYMCFVGYQDTDNLWWDSFATDFFEDDATLTLTFGLEDGLKRYSMWETLCAYLHWHHHHYHSNHSHSIWMNWVDFLTLLDFCKLCCYLI